MKYKFNVGDIVTIIDKEFSCYGKSFKITVARESLNGLPRPMYQGKYGAYEESELVLTTVYNSPLYKALQE